MNAKLKMNIILTLTAVLILFMVSCTNPTGLNVTSYIEPSTGIDTDPVTGLIAGLPLEGDAILSNPDVFVSDTVTWETGLSGSAMRGDEDGDFFRITDGTLPELTTAGTVEVWIYPEHTVDSDNFSAGILHKGDEIDFTDEAWSLQNWNTEQIAFNYQPAEDGAPYVQLISDDRISVENWHHIAVTWSCDDVSGDVNLKLYIDGVLNKSSVFAGIGPMVDSAGDLLVGSQLPEPYAAPYYHMSFMGMIDEISVYDQVRTASEIDSDYEAYSSIL